VVLVVSDGYCRLFQGNCLRKKNHGAPVAGRLFFFFLDNKSERRVRSGILLTVVFLV